MLSSHRYGLELVHTCRRLSRASSKFSVGAVYLHPSALLKQSICSHSPARPCSQYDQIVEQYRSFVGINGTWDEAAVEVHTCALIGAAHYC